LSGLRSRAATRHAAETQKYAKKKRLKLDGVQAFVLNGEVCVQFPHPSAASYTRPATQRFNKHANKNRNILLSDTHTFSVRDGAFGFHSRKFVGDKDIGDTNFYSMQSNPDAPDDKEPLFIGEYYLDTDFRHRVEHTRLVL
jgi:hypothetical protein